MARTKYGEQRACRMCDSDIAFHGSKEGWRDRGGVRFCDESGAHPMIDGAWGNYPHRLHRPYPRNGS
jgi:hypothetical protein